MTIEYGPTLAISKEIHEKKYRNVGETFKEAMSRVAGNLQDNQEHYLKFKEVLYNMRFLPGGRVQSASGSARIVTAFNCYVMNTIPDSMEGIMSVLSEAAETLRMGGGVGYDFSTLRPRGANIRSLDSSSSGPLGFMGVYDALCACISSAGHRRGAQMGVLRVDHPDIIEFVNAKNNSTNLTNFNTSVLITDKFMEAVRSNSSFDLVFEGRVYDTINANNLWETILRSTWDWAEPGVIFIDRVNKKNNLWYCETISATNPCVSGDTPILTKYGYQIIDEVVGGTVSVWNGFEFSEVQVKCTGENQPTKIVNFSDGTSLACTYYHKFYLADGTVKDAKDLKPGDKLLKNNWPVCEPNDMFEDIYDDVDEAYEMGFFSGDGWFKGENKAYIGLYGDKKKLIKNFSSYFSFNEYKISGGYKGTNTDETKIYLYFGKKLWSKTFVPKDNWTVGSKKAWLRGLMDSDGHVTKDGNAQISSKDREFLFWVKLLLNELGATGTLSEMKDYWRLSIPASYYYSLNLGCRHGSVSPNRSATRFVQVSSIEEGEVEEKVYCFTEPKKGMGIFNGVLTGQCGEQPLPPYGACLLGSFNMVKYTQPSANMLKMHSWKINYAQLAHDIPYVVRAMDNVIDTTTYPLPEQEKEAKSKRRMGLGVTGMANAIEALGYPYGSDDYIREQEKIMTTIRDGCYRASVELAIEKGPFPLFDVKLLESDFAKTLPEDIRDLIRTHGLRNSHLLSVAPTGTISLTADNISSGIEPVFSYGYDRTIRDFDGVKTERVEDYGYRVYGVEGRTADSLSPFDHVRVLNSASKLVDSACSKTCNIGNNVTWEDFKKVYDAAYDGGSSGCTTFRSSGKRYGILNASAVEEVYDEPEKEVGSFDEGTACYIDPMTGQPSCS